MFCTGLVLLNALSTVCFWTYIASIDGAWCTHINMTVAGMYHIATLLSNSKLSLCMYPSFIRFCRHTDNFVALVKPSQPCEDFLA